jgi:hypothetical protein
MEERRLNPYRAFYEALENATKGNAKNALALLASWALSISLMWAADWQQEIIDILIRDGNECYWLPVFFLGCQNIWVWRDNWMIVGWIAWAIVAFGTLISVWYWN